MWRKGKRRALSFCWHLQLHSWKHCGNAQRVLACYWDSSMWTSPILLRKLLCFRSCATALLSEGKRKKKVEVSQKCVILISVIYILCCVGAAT